MHTQEISLPQSWLAPRLPFPCHALMTSRHFAQESNFNLALHVGDDFARVWQHRDYLSRQLPSMRARPIYVRQVHGTHIHHAQPHDAPSVIQPDAIVADGLFTQTRGLPLVIMTADCLPIVMVDQKLRALAVVHAGWRGLANGVVHNALTQFDQVGCDAKDLHVWIGAAIGACHFEVGADVLAAFIHLQPDDQSAVEKYFQPISDRKYLANLNGLACWLLKSAGVPAAQIEVADVCTFKNHDFFSHRRDGKGNVFCGRMASVAWL